jgi:heat shock protein HslJ
MAVATVQSFQRAGILGLGALLLGLAVFTLAPRTAPAQLPKAAPAQASNVTLTRVPETPATPQRISSPITQSPWLWQRTERLDGTTVVAPDPNKYVVTFQPDGHLTLKADCNRGDGPYSVSGSQLTIPPVMSTLMGCLPPEQGGLFQHDVAQTTSFTFEGEHLILFLKGDGGHMVFSPRPPSP